MKAKTGTKRTKIIDYKLTTPKRASLPKPRDTHVLQLSAAEYRRIKTDADVMADVIIVDGIVVKNRYGALTPPWLDRAADSLREAMTLDRTVLPGVKRVSEMFAAIVTSVEASATLAKGTSK